MRRNLNRRQMLDITGKTVIGTFLGAPLLSARATAASSSSQSLGAVYGDMEGGKVGMQMLRDGGNAIDAAIAACFTSMIAQPSKCGPGGYGGSMMIGLANGTVTSVDFNSTAPAAATPDMYPLDQDGNVKGRINFHGWLAAGVPGTMAGLELGLRKYGTKSLGEILDPAIALAKTRTRKKEPFDYGALAAMLSTLAKRNSADSFYRGDIAQEIADGFKKNGGLVTAKDLASYAARELRPHEISWKDFRCLTAPICSAGIIALEAVQFLKAMKWEKNRATIEAAHAKLEALRLAWKDRWDLFGDPEFVKVPIEKLLSTDYAQDAAAMIRATVKAGKALPLQIERTEQSGTMSISAVDNHGNMIACTLTHGGSYGSRATVESLGLVLGHGMSRFDPRPGKPNSPGPGKRPMHNMAPTILMKNGKPVIAIGAAGGTKIPSAIYDFLTNYIGRKQSFEEAIDAPRLNTVGTMDLRVEKTWPETEKAFFRKLGYKIIDYPGAVVSAVTFNPKTGAADGRFRSGNPFQEGEGRS